MSGDPQPNKEHLPCPSSLLHDLGASPGHSSAGFHHSLGTLSRQLWTDAHCQHCSAGGSCPPRCDAQKTGAFGSGPQQGDARREGR